MKARMKRLPTVLAGLALLAPLAAGSCSSRETVPPGDPDAGDAGSLDADIGEAASDRAAPSADTTATGPTFCSLPGSVVSTAGGRVIVPGPTASATPDIAWLALPVGFCAHYFATVPTARQLRFGPGGDLFVASPTQGTTGGANNGTASVVVLPDDNRDGIADATMTFVSGLPSVQGLMFAAGFFYYQDGTAVRSVPFQPGDRHPRDASQTVTDMGVWPQAPEHWPRVFDVTRDGRTVYITNGGSQGDDCVSTQPVRGGIFTLNADGTTSAMATGFRNPIAMRCESNHDVCLAIELALDYSAGAGGREKIAPVRQGDDWGYPCCATQNLPYAGVTYSDTGAVPDCTGVAPESDSFIIGHTPFGLDFETGLWPAPWTDRVFVTLHGDFGSWSGARVVAVALDPKSGLPLPATELFEGGASATNMLEFATGWDDGNHSHGRPAPVAFAPDGRLFLGDDQQGAVIWIAPVDLVQP
jgi:glucose/arabinose dehydrogenase